MLWYSSRGRYDHIHVRGGTTLCTGQLSREICCRRAKNAKWRQNVSTREGPVLSGPGPATATRHSTKNIWNWSVKNLVNYAELYICIYLKTKALIKIRLNHRVLLESFLSDYFASIKMIENTKIEDDCLCRLDPYTGSCFWKHFLLQQTKNSSLSIGGLRSLPNCRQNMFSVQRSSMMRCRWAQ